jgi:UDPglucose 6-dehydrogenase
MRISIFGTGYVGAVTGICFSEWGHEVIFYDIDDSKLDQIEKGDPPVFEPGLQEILRKNKKNIVVERNPGDAVLTSDVSFICVGTPSREDGSIDLQFIEDVSQEIGKALAQKKDEHTVVVKSTVVPGTIEQVIVPILERESGKKAGEGFHIVSNPEFLREGNAVDDFFHPDRVIIGAENVHAASLIRSLYEPVTCPVMETSVKTAEMIKYVNNAFLATKISFTNEIGNICKKIGIDSYEVFRGVGMDSRINPSFFRSGIGFGGSCLPKDIRALVAFSKKNGVKPLILNAVLETNKNQPGMLVDLLKQYLDLRMKTVGILGLAFKPGTDDVRESRAIPVIRKLREEGARIVAYDPLASDNFRRIFPDITYAPAAQQVLDADAILIITEWPEFEQLDFSGKIVIDGRRIRKARTDARIYQGVCW